MRPTAGYGHAVAPHRWSRGTGNWLARHGCAAYRRRSPPRRPLPERTMRIRYPRTPHLPWSPGAGPDDVRITGLSGLEGRAVVVTGKLDGENTTLYRDGLHARSADSGHHPSRAWVKALHGRIGDAIPAGWRVCGENPSTPDTRSPARIWRAGTTRSRCGLATAARTGTPPYGSPGGWGFRSRRCCGGEPSTRAPYAGCGWTCPARRGTSSGPSPGSPAPSSRTGSRSGSAATTSGPTCTGCPPRSYRTAWGGGPRCGRSAPVARPTCRRCWPLPD